MKKVIGEGIAKRIVTARPERINVGRYKVSVFGRDEAGGIQASLLIHFPARLERVIDKGKRLIVLCQDGSLWRVCMRSYGRHSLHRQVWNWEMQHVFWR